MGVKLRDKIEKVTINKQKKKMSKQIIKKAGRVPKKKKQEIMEQLENIVTEGTILGVTNQQLAEKFKVNRETIACYLKEIYKKIPEDDIKETEVKLKAMFDKIFRFSQQLLKQASTTMEKERAIRLLLTAMKEYTDFLERFGFKPKAQENINLQGEVNHNHFVVEVIDNRDKVMDIN